MLIKYECVCSIYNFLFNFFFYLHIFDRLSYIKIDKTYTYFKCMKINANNIYVR